MKLHFRGDFYELRQKTHRIQALFICLALVCACSPDTAPADVPTLMVLPTDDNGETDTPATRTPPPTWTETTIPTPTATETPQPSETATLPPTLTPTVTPSLTITPTPTFTESATPTMTPTPTQTEAARALNALVALALQATVLPQPTLPPAQVSQPVQPVVPAGSVCASPPTSGFSVPYASDATLAAQLGCPVGTDVTAVTAVQAFERGLMVYVSGQPGTIYALYNNGAFQRYTDSFVEGADPERSDEAAPTGLLVPVRGFLKVWGSHADVRSNLGFAVTEEAGNESRLLQFERGRMIFLPQRNQTVSLLEIPGSDTGTWRVTQGGG